MTRRLPNTSFFPKAVFRITGIIDGETAKPGTGNRHADLLFELISRRDQNKSTVVTTTKPFGQWHEVFPNASCVVSLIDRLVHRCEVVAIGVSADLRQRGIRIFRSIRS